MPKQKNKPTKPSGVYMPKKTNTINARKQVKKRNFKRKLKGKRTHTKRNLKYSNILILILSLLVLFGLIFLSIRFIKNLRNTEDETEETYVIGLQNIPAYPGSEFIFETNTEDPAISNFISAGNSAYRLPSKVTTLKVLTFYDEKLPERGWEKVLSVETGSDDKKEGDYWIKEGTGLRIYSKFNDIWYETITVEEAVTGLANEVKEEIEREMLLVNSDSQDLLPDYPWVLKVPKEYVIQYSSSGFEDLRKAIFKKLGQTETVWLTPIGYTGAKELDFFLENYMATLEEQNATIINTFLMAQPGIRGTVNVDGKENLVAVIPNYYNNVVYVLHANESESPFFEYILENLEDQDDTKF
jgi:hypothetical protein